MVAAFGLTGPCSREQSWATGGKGGGRENLQDSERERERERRAYDGGATRGKTRLFTGARQRGDGGAEAKRLINRYYTGVKQRTAPP